MWYSPLAMQETPKSSSSNQRVAPPSFEPASAWNIRFQPDAFPAASLVVALPAECGSERHAEERGKVAR